MEKAAISSRVNRRFCMLDTVVWLDQTKALIYGLDQEGTHQTALCLELGAASGEQRQCYFDQLGSYLKDANRILLTGPGLPKQEFAAHLGGRYPEVLRRSLGVEELPGRPKREEILSSAQRAFMTGPRGPAPVAATRTLAGGWLVQLLSFFR
jgi:hypothetical protein